MKFLFFFILFYAAELQAFSLFKKRAKPSTQTKQLNEKPKAKTCSQKGVETLFKKEYQLSVSDYFNKKKSQPLWHTPIDVVLANKSSQNCSKPCQQKNHYQFFVQTKPSATLVKSCKKSEAKEVYSFKKTFKTTPSKTAKQSMLSTAKLMNQWHMQTFVYPYSSLMFPSKPHSKEHKTKLHSACPSCSFYTSYSYTYKKSNQIDFDIKIRCGDIKKSLFTKQKTVLVVKNHWKCTKK